MTAFLDTFPKVNYQFRIKGKWYIVQACNVLYRLAFIQEILNNIDAYYMYKILDGDRPDTLADKIYGDATAFWMITLANNMQNPLFDWPKDSSSFYNYIISTYGSMKNASQTIHHYEKLVTRVNDTSGVGNSDPVTSKKIVWIDGNPLSNTSIPKINQYDTFQTTPGTAYNTYTIGKSVISETITTTSVSNYDYEFLVNESKRSIKIIRPDYYPTILAQFNNIVGNNPAFMRTLS